MRFSVVAASAALVATATANYGYGNFSASAIPASYVTETYVDYTTVCPEPTVLTIGAKTYTVTEATTLTVTACSCTLTKPVYTSLATICSTSAAVVVPVTTAAPYYPVGTAPSVVVPSVKPTGTGAYTAPIATFTGAANNVVAASGAGLAALFGVVAYVL